MKKLINEKRFKSAKKAKNYFQNKIAQIGLPQYTLFSIYAIITGAIVGLGAVFFHKSIDFVTELFFNYGSEKLYFLGAGAVILFPIIGMIIQSLMTSYSPVTAQKRGVSEVIKAVATRGGFIRLRTTIFHFIAPVINIGSGGTVGPEGPAAQIGAGLASKFSELVGISDSKRRMFTAAGSGAAIAAVFNSPLAGIFFALEIVLLNDFQTVTFSAMILASVTASAISRIFLGNHPAFQFVHHSFSDYGQLYLFAILGIVSGIFSLIYISYSDSVNKLFKNYFLKKYPRWISMSVVGAIVGISGYFYHDIFGIGYAAMNAMLANAITWKIILILMVLKFLLVPLILGSGGFGGVFAPTLFIGGCFGYLFALAFKYFWGVDADPITFSLVGMGALLGGINSIPITAILLIFEMTKDYSFMLPLMLAVVISTTIVQLSMKGSSIHIKHLESLGYNIIQGKRADILQAIQVKEIMREDVVLISGDTKLPVLMNRLLESHHGTFYTINGEGKITGAISENEIRPIITEYEQLKSVLIAEDVARKNIIMVNENDSLDKILKLFGNRNVDEFLVVSADNPSKIIGTVWRQDLISAYNRESLKYNLADGLAHEIKKVDKSNVSRVAKGYSIVEKKVKSDFVGRTLAEIKLRNKYGLEVLMIKQNLSPFDDEEESDKIIMPDPNYVLQSEDTLVLFGQDIQLKQTQNWD